MELNLNNKNSGKGKGKIVTLTLWLKLWITCYVSLFFSVTCFLNNSRIYIYIRVTGVGCVLFYSFSTRWALINTFMRKKHTVKFHQDQWHFYSRLLLNNGVETFFFFLVFRPYFRLFLCSSSHRYAQKPTLLRPHLEDVNDMFLAGE